MQEVLRRGRRRLFLVTIAMGLTFLGCDSDQRLVELSQESLNRQAEQNAQVTRQSQTVAESTHELIKAEASVQGDANQLQQQLHEERSALDQQRHDLESERRSLAAERQREPIIAESIKGVGLVVAAALPLVVCWYLLKSLLLAHSEDALAAEVLLEELATQGPLLIACMQNALPGALDERKLPPALPPPA